MDHQETTSLIPCLLQDATIYSAHVPPLRVTEDQDKGHQPPSQSPDVLQPSRVTSDFAFCLMGWAIAKDSTEIVQGNYGMKLLTAQNHTIAAQPSPPQAKDGLALLPGLMQGVGLW